MGTSYGGYATLVGLTRNPELYACGVDIVGPSNLETLLRTIPPYWESIRSDLYRAIGDIATEAGLAQARERSPLFRADRIRRPLLIAQGANDPRVKQAESDQMVAALRASGIPVTYVLFPDEGHGFVRPENAIACNGLIETFLAEHLGGQAEPITPEQLAASTATMMEQA
jgi:dipeptidyl aminopeptidase/acylaminoacyl peptidase